jgi:hypothetical protein
MQSVESYPTFRRNMSPPFIGSKNKQALRTACFTLFSCLTCSSTLEMEATCQRNGSLPVVVSVFLTGAATISSK